MPALSGLTAAVRVLRVHTDWPLTVTRSFHQLGNLTFKTLQCSIIAPILQREESEALQSTAPC